MVFVLFVASFPFWCAVCECVVAFRLNLLVVNISNQKRKEKAMSLARTVFRVSLVSRRCHFSSVVPTSSTSSLLDKALEKLQKTFLPHTGPLEPIVLYDALHCDEFWEDDWMSTSDKSYGGPSHATLTYAVDTPLNKKGIDDTSGEKEEKDIAGDGVTEIDAHGNNAFHGFPFMRFEGSLDMSSRRAQDLGVSGGFCAIRFVNYWQTNTSLMTHNKYMNNIPTLATLQDLCMYYSSHVI